MLYKCIGLMSGTSLDGLDIAYCEFEYNNNQWDYSIKQSRNIPYNNKIRNRLIEAENTSSSEFVKIDKEFGVFLGEKTKEFIDDYKLKVDFISSHGQTIFHQPNINLTTQIGDINSIASITNTKTIGDFRRKDLALNGQGAPLVPIGDRLLFSSYPYCLNLGGFSNISFEKDNKRIAYDICPVNIVLNTLAQRDGKPYDNDGEMAREGNINFELLESLNQLEYYKLKDKKSLGKEWVMDNIFPLLDSYEISNIDLISTFTNHIAIQLANNINGDVLITGGGAYNKYLISLIQNNINSKIHIPDSIIIEYKEALIFAFLGVLRLREEINCLSSVTGAIKDSCIGTVVL